MSYRTLRNASLAGLTACLFVTFLILSWLNYDSSRAWALEEITKSALPLTRDNIYSEIHAELIQPLFVATTMANDSFLKDWALAGETDPDPVVRYLDEIHRKYGFFSVFYVSAITRNYYHYKGLHKVVSTNDAHDVWFFRFIDLEREYELDVDVDQAGLNALTVFLNFRVEGPDGAILGVTGVGMKMETVSHLLDSAQQKYGRRIYLVNRDGLVRAHSRHDLIGVANLLSMPGVSAVAAEILATLDRMVDLNYDGAEGPVYLTARFIPELDWFLVVEQDESVALINARQNFRRTLAFGAVAWVALVALILWGSQRSRLRLEEMAHTDPLTGLANRRSFEEAFDEAVSRVDRFNESFSLILADIDGFKAVNDSLGHAAGDTLLRRAAESMAAILRPMDRLARWGGDEFILLAACPPHEALKLADRLRAAVRDAARQLAEGDPGDARAAVSISCGIVPLIKDVSLHAHAREADRLLYRCKQHGGDRALADPMKSDIAAQADRR